MAYTGIAKPFAEPIHNRLEILAEVLILINSYFMMLYSPFVVDEEARYTMGFYNIWIIKAHIAVNLVIIIYTIVHMIKKQFRKCQLKHLRAKRLKDMKRRAKRREYRHKYNQLKEVLYGKEPTSQPTPENFQISNSPPLVNPKMKNLQR